jgi:hypothetical protein
MVKIVLFSLFVFFYFMSFSQELQGYDPNKKTEPNYVSQGLLKASATISPGKMIQNGSSTINLSGFLEYFIDNKFSLRGDVYQFIDDQNSTITSINPSFQNRLFFGAFYNYGKGNIRWYNGFQMGLTTTNYLFNSITGDYKWSLAPSTSFKTGVSYYVWKYFHFFADVTYLNSTLRGASFGSQRMDEIIFSGGLGFQIQTKKQTKKFRISGTPSF